MIRHTTYIINIWLADSLMLYRTFIIWRTIPVLIFPIVVYLGTLGSWPLSSYGGNKPMASTFKASGLRLLILMGQPGGTFGDSLVIPFGTAFFSISVALNVILTSLISYYLLHQRQRVRVLRITEAGDCYTDISIAPNLIVFRIAIGVDFKGEKVEQASSFQFNARAIGGTSTLSESTLHQNFATGSTKTTRILGENNSNMELYALRVVQMYQMQGTRTSSADIQKFEKWAGAIRVTTQMHFAIDN
ncbi:hypothetical protein DFH07DRAFT_768442 [Mycena maculata]|uniref:Uncharacterized protein n=1 Tax=Mycena maculata TaxID=230809 RepID=A0AAD7JSH5_9AGAR|nr:hypothetical protein DFH07DRAFT_768442 [Mycena maculata]